jgi:hypothetical protein
MRIFIFCFLMSVFLPIMAQKAYVVEQIIPNNAKEIKSPIDTLWPGNSLSASNFVLIADSLGGYVIGTNSYHDICKGQQFKVDSGYIIDGAIYWFGTKKIVGGGNLKFIVWRMDSLDGYTMAGENEPSPGTELGYITVSINEVDTSSLLDSTYVVTFPSAIPVIDDYVIGFDMSGLLNDTIGLISTSNGDGNGNELVWEKWYLNNSWHTLQASGWGNPTPLDVDAMILPIVDLSSFGINQAPEINGLRCTAFPMPSVAGFTLNIEVQKASTYNQVEIIDMTGKNILRLDAGSYTEGQNSVYISTENVPSGKYYCIVTADNSKYALGIQVIH